MKESFFEFVSDKITQTDQSGYLTQYPPLFTWTMPVRRTQMRAWQGYREEDRLGIYVHIPFCEHKCSYCRYFSREKDSPDLIGQYLKALLKEMKIYSGFLKGQKVRTLYVGGGTPSILSVKQLEELFDALDENFSMKDVVQKCVEVNPSSASQDKLLFLKERGVNRLTVGVQSLNKKVLSLVGRDQDPAESLRCLESVKQIGFQSINVDIMAGLPGESISSFLKGFRKILSLSPGMIHVHPFYPTEHTRFAKDGFLLNVKMKSLRQAMCDLAGREMIKGGYKRISFDAMGLTEKDRNVQLADAVEAVSSFLGLGACAVSHVKGRLRYVNEQSIEGYLYKLRLGRLPVKAVSEVGIKEEMIYYIVAVLRYGSLDKRKFMLLFCEDVRCRFGGVIDYLKSVGRLTETDIWIRLNVKSIEEYVCYSKYFFDLELLKPYEDEFRAWSKEEKTVYL